MSKQHVKTDRRAGRSVKQCPKGRVAADKKAAKETRVDAPHILGFPVGVGKSAASAEIEIPAADSSTAASADSCPVENDSEENRAGQSQIAIEESSPDEQLCLHAAQLGEQLRRKQQELDRREALLNAREARLENDARSTRLWLSENRGELAEREDRLAQENGRLQESLKRLAEAEQAVSAAQTNLDGQTKQLNDSRKQFESERGRAQDELDFERQKIDTRRRASLVLVQQSLAGLERRREQTEERVRQLMEKAARPSKELLAREEKSRALAEEHRRRLHEVLEAEESLAAEKVEVAEFRRGLLAEREALHRQDQLRRHQAVEERTRMQTEWDNKRRQLACRGEELDRAHAALIHLRAELSEMHRATLEMRLAVEELWMQLSGAVPPATLTQSLGEIRRRLAETYRAEKDELAERRRELADLTVDLAEQHKLIARQKAELDAWIARREREIEEQAARLIAREEELHNRETHFEEASQEWAAQRLVYQEEIRRLRVRFDDLAESGKISSGMCGVF